MNDESGRIRLLTKRWCVGELLEEMITALPTFQEHVHIKRIHVQSNSFEKDKQIVINVTVLQCDFVMTYSCEYQSEVQSALWSKQSVNLYTVALYYKNMPCKCSHYNRLARKRKRICLCIHA